MFFSKVSFTKQSYKDLVIVLTNDLLWCEYYICVLFKVLPIGWTGTKDRVCDASSFGTKTAGLPVACAITAHSLWWLHLDKDIYCESKSSEPCDI